MFVLIFLIDALFRYGSTHLQVAVVPLKVCAQNPMCSFWQALNRTMLQIEKKSIFFIVICFYELIMSYLIGGTVFSVFLFSEANIINILRLLSPLSKNMNPQR